MGTEKDLSLMKALKSTLHSQPLLFETLITIDHLEYYIISRMRTTGHSQNL